MKSLNNQRGNITLVALTILAIGAIAIAVTVALQNDRPTKVAAATPKPSASPTTSAAPTTSPSPTQPPSGKAASLIALAQNLYTAYNKSPNESVARPYLTKAFDAKIKAGGTDTDQILCAQNQPSAFRYDQPTITGNTAKLDVHETFGQSDNIVTVSVDLDSMLVSGVTCHQ